MGVPNLRDFQKSFSVSIFATRFEKSDHSRGLEQMMLMRNQMKHVTTATIIARM
jgi:hypothetical protein